MTKYLLLAMTASLGLLMNASGHTQQEPGSELQAQVMEIERAFAQTMADRDFQGFVSLLSDEAVFLSGETPLEGKQAVADAWQRFYEGESAPFSWAPGQVLVLESGGLALSTGPVFDPSGKQIATFTSIWRQEATGVWRIVFDRGCEVCDCSQP